MTIVVVILGRLFLFGESWIVTNISMHLQGEEMVLSFWAQIYLVTELEGI